MAIVTKTIASDAGGAARLEIDYDNATSPPTFKVVRVFNSTAKNYLIDVAKLDNTQTTRLIFSPNGGVARTFNIPASGANQYAFVNSKGTVETNIATSWPTDLAATPGL